MVMIQLHNCELDRGLPFCKFCQRRQSKGGHDHTGEVCPICGSAEENTIARFEQQLIREQFGGDF